MQVHSVAPEQQTGNISIKGHVVDNKGEVLIGVTVMVKGTNNGVITDMNGNFTITAKNGQTLVLSYIGYKDVEVKVQQSNLNITMQEDAQALDEVVVFWFLLYFDFHIFVSDIGKNQCLTVFCGNGKVTIHICDDTVIGTFYHDSNANEDFSLVIYYMPFY